MLRPVRVGAHRHHRPAEVAVELEHLARGLEVPQPVADAGRVDLDAPAVRDDPAQDLCHDVAHALERVGPKGVVAVDEVQVAEDAVVVEALHHGEHLLVVGAVDLVLGASLLEVAIPELAVSHLVDRADHEVEPLAQAGHELVAPSDRVRLHAQLEAGSQSDVTAELVARRLDLVEVGLIGAVGDRAPALEARSRRLVPLGLHPVVDVLGEADLVEVEPQRVERHLAQRVGGVVGVAGVNVVVGEHGGPFRRSTPG